MIKCQITVYCHWWTQCHALLKNLLKFDNVWQPLSTVAILYVKQSSAFAKTSVETMSYKYTVTLKMYSVMFRTILFILIYSVFIYLFFPSNFENSMPTHLLMERLNVYIIWGKTVKMSINKSPTEGFNSLTLKELLNSLSVNSFFVNMFQAYRHLTRYPVGQTKIYNVLNRNARRNNW